MEREKQKQMEKEQDLEQRRIMLEQKRLAEEQAFKELQQENSTGVIRSKFVCLNYKQTLYKVDFYKDDIIFCL